MFERVRFDAEIYKAVGGAVEHCDTYEELRESGVRYTTHAVTDQQQGIWLGLGGDIDLGSVKFTDREGCSRSVLRARFVSDGVWLRQGFYRGPISLSGPGIDRDAGDALRPWAGGREPSTGRPSDAPFKSLSQDGVFLEGEAGSVLIELPDIFASLILRWTPTDEPVTSPRSVEGSVTPAPLLDDIRADRKDIELHSTTILYLIVDQVLARNNIADSDGSYMAEILNALQAEGHRLLQKGSKSWDKDKVQSKRAAVKLQLGQLGYRSSTRYFHEKQLPAGTLNWLVWRAQQIIDAQQ